MRDIDYLIANYDPDRDIKEFGGAQGLYIQEEINERKKEERILKKAEENFKENTLEKKVGKRKSKKDYAGFYAYCSKQKINPTLDIQYLKRAMKEYFGWKFEGKSKGQIYCAFEKSYFKGKDEYNKKE